MHVYPRRHHASHKARAKKSVLDLMIYAIAILSPIMTLPQVLQIWVDRNTQGLSVITWGAYFFFALFWLFYGLRHHEKPIILSNVLMGALYIVIVTGVLLYQ